MIIDDSFIFTSDLSHSETRLSVFIDGFEGHLFNRSATYANLEKLFGLVPSIFKEDKCNEDLVKGRLVYISNDFFCH